MERQTAAWESNGKWWMKGAGEAATGRGTYAGTNSRMGVKRQAGGDKDAQQTKSEGRELRELSEGRSVNERALAKRECPPDAWKERDETQA